MSETFSYERKRRVDKAGRRWHFVYHNLDVDKTVPYDERPYELLFRDDERREFGRIRFDRRKDNPYRDYEALVRKIMSDAKFRRSLRDPATEKLWRKSWK